MDSKRPGEAAGHRAVSPWLVERLAELRRHLDYLRVIRPRVAGKDGLEIVRRGLLI